MEFLQQIDASLFMFFNVDLANPFFDWFMPFITKKTHWFPVWAVLAVLLIWKDGSKKIWLVPLVFLVTAMADIYIYIFDAPQNSAANFLLIHITKKTAWVPVLALITSAAIIVKRQGNRKGITVVVMLLLAVILADLGVNRVLKPLFERVRPCNTLEGVHLIVRRSRGLSMPSSHAANFFAVAAIFSYFYRRYQAAFWFIASLVAYSRVAVGVHYPFDILAGAVCGVLFAGFWLIIFNKWYLAKNPQLRFELF